MNPLSLTEYVAWRRVVEEFRDQGIDVNTSKNDRLIKAICLWGERLHALRAEQTTEQVRAALNHSTAAYHNAD